MVDAVDSLRARLLQVAAAISGSMAGVFLIWSIVVHPAPAYMYGLGAVYLLGSGAVFATATRGRAERAAQLFVATNWVMATLFLITEGPGTGHVGIYFVAVILAGLLRRPGAAALVAAASACALVAAQIAVSNGYRPPGAPQPELIWSMQVSQLLAAGLLTGLVTLGFHRAVRGLKQSRAELEIQNAALRDQADFEARMQHNQKMEAIGRLAGGVAHDINNILTVVLGNAQNILHDEKASPDTRHGAQDIVNAGKSAARVTAQLVALSQRPAAGATVLDAAPIVQSLCAWFGRLLGAPIRLELHATEPAWVRIDVAQIEQLVLNLVVNAQDAMPDGGVLGVRLRGADGGCVELQVSDTGTGIPQDQLPSIFLPTFSTKASGRGSGLGLSTVQRIVEDAGGTIAVESAPGAGTTFTVRLPAAAPEPSKIAAPRGDSHDPAGLRLLLVDDDPPVRAVAERLLVGAGYDVTSCGGLGEVVALLDAGHRFAGLITDMVLADGNGAQVARAVRAAQADVSVLFVSGHTAGILRTQGVGEEAEFLAKPYSSADFLEAVRRALSSTRAQSSESTLSSCAQ